MNEASSSNSLVFMEYFTLTQVIAARRKAKAEREAAAAKSKAERDARPWLFKNNGEALGSYSMKNSNAHCYKRGNVPYATKFFKVTPKAWNRHASMRVGFTLARIADPNDRYQIHQGTIPQSAYSMVSLK